MEIYKVKNRNEELLKELLNVWKSSVKATHLFLSDKEIGEIKEYVPHALENVENLVVAENESEPVAFMGTENGRLEMLFVSPMQIGKGIGKEMVQYGIKNYGVFEVTVNEQNPQAVGFYKHVGFETYKRTDLDEEGRPYPLLYMKLM